MVYPFSDSASPRLQTAPAAPQPSSAPPVASAVVHRPRASRLDRGHLAQLHRSSSSDNAAGQTGQQPGPYAAMTAQAGPASVLAEAHATAPEPADGVRRRRAAVGEAGSSGGTSPIARHPAAYSAMTSVATSGATQLANPPHTIVEIDATSGSHGPAAPAASEPIAAPADESAAESVHGDEPEPTPCMSAAWRGASMWAAAALCVAGGTSAAIYFLEQLRKGILADRSASLLALSDLKNPFPREDVQRYVVPMEFVSSDGFTVPNYIEYGKKQSEDVLFKIANNALFRFVNDETIGAALGDGASDTKIALTLSKSSTGLYDKYGKMVGDDEVVGNQVPSVSSMPGSREISVDIQHVDFLSVYARKYEIGNNIGSDAVGYKTDTDHEYKPTSRDALYSPYFKPDVSFEFNAALGLMRSLQSPHFLKSYNSTSGQLPVGDMQRLFIDELAVQSFSSKPLNGAQPNKMLDDNTYASDRAGNFVYNRLADNALLGIIISPMDNYYYANGSDSRDGDSKYKTLPDFIRAVVTRITLPVVAQAAFDPTETGQAANQKLIEAMPQIFVNNPVPYVREPDPSPTPEPSASPTPTPQPSLAPGAKPSPSPF
jgi:hypothetical protein